MEKDVKKNSLRVLPCEDCIARVAGKKNYSFWLVLTPVSCNAAISAECDVLVNEKAYMQLTDNSPYADVLRSWLHPL